MSSKLAVSTVKDRCTEEKKKECEEKNKICNPKTGRCNIKSKSSIKLKPLQLQEEIKTKKTIYDFIKELKKYTSAKEAIENIFNNDDNAKDIIKKLNENNKENTKSKQGFIYELLWDICIKFNITDFTNKHTEHGIGNFNNLTNFEKIEKHINEYLNQGYISGNSGGYSDITFRTKHEEQDEEYDLNFVSVKYKKGDDIKDYDIQNLCTLIRDRERDNKYKSINTLLFVKDKEHLKNICKTAKQSSNILIKYISPHGNYENVYDLNDLETHYSKLRKILDDFNFLKDVDDFKENYLQIYKKKFIPRFHQELFIEKITSLIKKEQKKILVGAIPRSGKTYIMAGTILKDVKDSENADKNSKTKFNNYLIITPAPNETLEQYYKAFDNYYDFKNNNIVPINVKEVKIGKEFNEKIEYVEKPESNKHNVFLISKQRLGFRDRKDDDKEDNNKYIENNIENIKANIIKYFGDNKFKIIFFDEAHFGMSTKIAQDIFSELDKKDESYKIYVTATYNKPKQIYNIDNNNIIKWDLQDIRLIKNIEDKSHYKTLEYFKEKFGTKIFNKVVKNQKNTIIEQYKHFPEPILLTSVWDKDFVDEELEKIGNNETFGFDMHKLFMPQSSNKFKNEEQLIQLLEYYFGYYITDDESNRKKNNFYETKNEYKKRGVLPNIENICLNKCRTLQPEHKTTQLWFLPPYEISKITSSLIELLKNKFTYIFNNYMFYVAVEDVNGKTYDNVRYLGKPEKIKEEIENLEKELYTNAKYSKYEGLIILAGNRLQLGISLKNVDIVALFTNITASDTIYQMIFRSMTEIEDDIECDGKSYCGRKKYGFMVDLNPQRTLFTIDYLTDMYLDNDRFKGQNREKKMELIADLMNIDKHKFIDRYNREDKEGYENYVKEFFGKLYKAWDAKTENIQQLLLASNILDDDSDLLDSQIIHLLKIGNNNKEIKIDNKPQKRAVIKTENNVSPGKKKGKNNDENTKKEKGEDKSTPPKEIKAYLFAEIISILSLITSYTDNEGNNCVFKLENKENFVFELKQIIEKIIDNDAIIKNIFLHTLLKRMNLKYSNNEEEELYKMIKEKINNIEKKQRGGNILELNKQIQMRKSKIYSIKEPDKLLVFINDNLKPKKVEKRERGEVFTPMELVNEMLDTLPKEVWKNPKLKWLDPAAGMGNFPVAVYMRLMIGLKDVIKDEEKRRKHILENMLYMVELDKTNVFMMKKIFCGKKYKLNIFEGSFIDGKYEKIYKTDIIFDIIMGNPPYNKNKTPIWNIFINNSFKNLNINGYLLFVTPSGWRDIDGEFKSVKSDIYERNLLILKIHNENDGLKTFNCETRFDIILVQNKNVKETTTEIYYQNIKKPDIINIKKLLFIPNGNINFIKKLLANKNEEKVNLLYDSCSYHTQKDWIKGVENKIYKHKCIYTVNSNNIPTFKYSRIKYIKDIKKLENKCLVKNTEHFGNSKLIWSNGRIKSVGCYIDKKGIYGLTQFSYAILENDYNILNILEKVFLSKEFKNIMENCAVTEQSINYKIIALFKKDFYKYFLPKGGN